MLHINYIGQLVLCRYETAMSVNIGIHTLYTVGIWLLTNMPATLYMCVPLHCYCGLHIDPSLPFRSVKKKSVAPIYHAIATYTNYFISMYHITMSVYIPHMNLMQSLISPQTLAYIHVTIIAYAPEQICLSHHTWMSNGTNCRCCITAHTSQNKTMNCTFIYQAIAINVAAANKPLKCHICELLYVQTWVNCVNIYIYFVWPHHNEEPDQNTVIPAFHISLHIPLNKYACHIAHIFPTGLLL